MNLRMLEQISKRLFDNEGLAWLRFSRIGSKNANEWNSMELLLSLLGANKRSGHKDLDPRRSP